LPTETTHQLQLRHAKEHYMNK